MRSRLILTTATLATAGVLAPARAVVPRVGAHEAQQPPTIRALTVTKRTAHTLSFAMKVNPGGLKTSVEVTALYHGHGGGAGKSVRAGTTTTTTTVHLTVKPLHAHRTFRVHAVATNIAGKARAAVRTATTTPLHRS